MTGSYFTWCIGVVMIRGRKIFLSFRVVTKLPLLLTGNSEYLHIYCETWSVRSYGLRPTVVCIVGRPANAICIRQAS